MSEPRFQAVPRVAEPPQGDPALIAVDRALGELRRGRAIVVRDGSSKAWRLVVPIETAESALVAHVLQLSGAALVVTGERAAALRVPCESDEVLQLTLPAGLEAQQLHELGTHWEADGWRAALGGMVLQAVWADALCVLPGSWPRAPASAALLIGLQTGPACRRGVHIETRQIYADHRARSCASARSVSVA